MREAGGGEVLDDHAGAAAPAGHMGGRWPDALTVMAFVAGAATQIAVNSGVHAGLPLTGYLFNLNNSSIVY